jgi:hypothetical protein
LIRALRQRCIKDRGHLIDSAHFYAHDVAYDVANDGAPLRGLIVVRIWRDTIILGRDLIARNTNRDHCINNGALSLRVIARGRCRRRGASFDSDVHGRSVGHELSFARRSGDDFGACAVQPHDLRGGDGPSAGCKS